MKNFFAKYNNIITYILISFFLLFIASSFRHILFNSHAFDLGIFDNGIYLISQGKNPYVSFRELHILGDHAAWILYFIAPFYFLFPSVYWLFFIQSLASAIALIPIWKLSKLNNLSDSKAKTICLIYILYPLIFNVNLFDFHPEVITLPLFFIAILAVKLDKIIWFIVSILLILGCKAVLALNVVMMGVWLILIYRKKNYGAFAIFSGIFWFIIATQLIIPAFSGEEAAAVSRYAFLGDSVSEIALNLIIKPQIILSHLFTLANAEYLLLLFLPVIPVLAWQEIPNLIPAIPTLFLNLLTEYQPQKDLVHQYSLPIIPFLIFTIIASLAHHKTWFYQNTKIRIWSLILFLALAKYVYFFPNGLYLKNLHTWKASNEAISLINTSKSVFTAPQFAPHLTHRLTLDLAIDSIDYNQVNKFHYVLLNLDNPTGYSSQEDIKNLINFLEKNREFQLKYNQDNIFLFEKIK
ncbi:DUF2079 domain-containing protein [Cyanobacterium aponinum]|uniref:DUF2079 domain-containing protein n=1 Tax=Cyanobacterium aponinum 0216 TaxID=2676140 RepID=A0A844GWZ1_9CHRO|nr:DUF2079 domain-containing protein [Cyanobacterium aponinum]MTF38705.1 DUF2079 domain-containing protein [Cyanobacterium aponinum 0216]